MGYLLTKLLNSLTIKEIEDALKNFIIYDKFLYPNNDETEFQKEIVMLLDRKLKYYEKEYN